MSQQAVLPLTAPVPELALDRFPLDDQERAVWGILVQCRGKDKAIKAPSIMNVLDIGERELRAVIARLVVDHCARIGSGSCGFWVMESGEEINRVTAELHHRAMALLVREAVLKRVHLAELLGQMRLEAAVPPTLPSKGSADALRGAGDQVPCERKNGY